MNVDTGGTFGMTSADESSFIHTALVPCAKNAHAHVAGKKKYPQLASKGKAVPQCLESVYKVYNTNSPILVLALRTQR